MNAQREAEKREREDRRLAENLEALRSSTHVLVHPVDLDWARLSFIGTGLVVRALEVLPPGRVVLLDSRRIAT